MLPSREGRKHGSPRGLQRGSSIPPGFPRFKSCLIGTAIVAILTLLVSQPAAAQGDGLLIENISAPVIEAKPHRIISASFRVYNRTDSWSEFALAVELPPGWRLISPEFSSFILKPDAEMLLFVGVSIPQDARAGSYGIAVEVSTTVAPVITARADVDVELLAVADLEVHAPKGELRTYAGEIYVRTFTVVNSSNAATRVDVNMKSDRAWDVDADCDAFSLEPGESRPVVVTVFTPDDITREVAHRVTLTARALDLGPVPISAKAGVTTTVYPRLLEGDLYETLPGTYSLLFSWENGKDLAAQVELDLEGEFGDGHWGMFHIVGPYIPEWRGQRFLQEDSFLLKYGIDAAGSISIGDDRFSITPLTEGYFYGRGVDLKAFDEPFTFRAFAAKRRGGWLPERLAGAQLSMEAGDDTELIFTGMSKRESGSMYALDGEEREARTWSVAGKMNPAEGIELEGEYGWGDFEDSDGDGTKADDAYRLAARISRERFNFDGVMVHAGGLFSDYWDASDSCSAYTSWDVGRGVNLWGSATENKWDYGGDPMKPHPKYANQAVGVNFAAGGLGRAGVFQRWRSRKDTNLFEYDEEKRTTNFQLTRQYENFSFTAGTAFGRKIDFLTGDDGGIWQHQLMVTAQPDDDTIFAAGYRWDVEEAFGGGPRETTSQFWLNADIRVSSSTEFDATFSRSGGSNRRSLSWLRTDLKHRFKGGKILQLMTQWRGGDFGEDLAAAVRLTYPLSIPLLWLPVSGRLEGFIYAADDRMQPLSDVVVSVDGMKVATDEYGRFVFPSLPEGEYELRIERSTLGLDLIPDIALPLEFKIDAGEVIRLDIPAVRPAAVFGRVTIMPPPAGNQDAGGVSTEPVVRGYGGVLVILTRADESYRVYTDSHGRFRFTGLRPGRWTLSLPDDQVPEYHRLYPAEFVLHLAPGETVEDVEFVITQMERPIDITARNGSGRS